MVKIVLVHGFHMQKKFSLGGKERIEVLEEAIREKFPGAEIVLPEYLEKYKGGLFSVKKTISEYAGVVWSMAGKLDENTIIIGYSLGGLITRCMVEQMNFPAKAVILVGAPNRGVNLSWREKLLLKIVRIPCVEDMRKPGKFLRDILEIRSRNYYHIAGLFDKRIPLDSSFPGLENSVKDGQQYKRVRAIPCGHSQLIPVNREDIESSAIPAILEILKKEISA